MSASSTAAAVAVAVVAVIGGAGGGVIGGEGVPDPAGAVRRLVVAATMLSLLWMALTSYPYSCIGLT